MSSVFASRVTKVIPFREHTVTIRKLSPKHLGAAERAQQMKSIADLKAFGGPAFVKELQGLSDEKKQAEQAQADEERRSNPLITFDRDTLLAKGIVAWTFTDDEEQVATIDAEHIEDLDDDISEQLAREILQLAKPSLFEDGGEAQKND